MDKSQERSFDNSLVEEANIVTSTPMMRSEMGQQLIRRHFIKNLPKDISLPEVKIAINIEVTPSPKRLEPFVFKKEHDSDSEIYKFKTPTAISPETMERFRELFGPTPKPTRKRLRL